MPNRLASETSPYLLQHQDNPVDWFPWGTEAIELARREQRPIFLSIGYSACHWCHVMEHESFEDSRIAEIVNKNFVAIKVDREERPDIDQVYMTAVQAMTNHGGWPMSVFLTPDLKPFYGGTYFPPSDRGGMPGFDRVLTAVADAWQNRRQEAIDQSEALTRHLQSLGAVSGTAEPLRPELLRDAANMLERAFDFTYGGFGHKPKFPHPMDLEVLARAWARTSRSGYLDMIRLTLQKMGRGGIYDHLGGGFARYSVDERWLVPHFEKMLYDNALLAGAYLDGYLLTKDEEFAAIARGTLNYLLSDMTDPAGGIYSTEDADSEGVEGKFYVWTPAEIEAVLGSELGATFCYVFDVTQTGNFEHGASILNLPKSLEQCAAVRGWNLEELRTKMENARMALLAVRNRRVRPGRDDKVITSWNGLAIHALARAAVVLDEPKYMLAATRTAEFIRDNLSRSPTRLWHSWRNGKPRIDAFLDDYANFANALITLYEVTFSEQWLAVANRLAETILKHFEDRERGGFYYTADDQESLIVRSKEFHDGSTPSGNSMATTVLLRLAALTGRPEFRQSAERALSAAGSFLTASPTAAGQMLIAADMASGPMIQYVVTGPDGDDTLAAARGVHKRFIPNRIVCCRTVHGDRCESLDSLFEGRSPGSEVTAYVCEGSTCRDPAVGLNAVESLWKSKAPQ